MARMTVDGFDFADRQLGKLLDRGNVRRIVEAGARASADEMRLDIKGSGHVRTGSMLANVRPAEYHEFLDGGEMNVYPQGEDGKGVGNALKAFVINYGRKGRRRRTARMGDRFITGKLPQTEKAVQVAMQAESDRILDEINR